MTAAPLLLFDLDGTLLRADRTVHPGTRQALQAAARAGARVGIATGRPPRSARPHRDALGLAGPVPLVCFNGCEVRLDDDAPPLLAHRLPRDIATEALHAARAAGVHANVYVGDDIFIREVTATSQQSAVKDGIEQVPVGDLPAHLDALGGLPTKVLFIAPEPVIAGFEQQMRAALEPRASLVRSEPTYLELLPAGVSKGAALDALAAHLGVAPADVVAFGDNLNDLEMLEAAGLGVAMGNAHEGLKAVADVVIGDHDSDTIGRFVARHMNLPAPT